MNIEWSGFTRAWLSRACFVTIMIKLWLIYVCSMLIEDGFNQLFELIRPVYYFIFQWRNEGLALLSFFLLYFFTNMKKIDSKQIS